MAETPAEYNARLIGEFRANSGRVGGIWEGTPLLLLHHTGAKSGVSRVNPLAYLPDDAHYLIWAANGGAPKHPAWYQNLKTHPITRIEVGSETIDVVAEEATGDQRDRLFARAAERYPSLGEIAQKTRRVIPLMVLTPLASRREAMTDHRTGTHEEWLAARLELLAAEKEHMRRGDELARRRRELPWVPVDKDYRFETEQGTKSLADLFDGRSQLLVYHLMFGYGDRVDEQNPGCVGCSFVADHFDAVVPHLNGHEVTLVAESIGPLQELRRYKERMGWRFPWVSSLGSDFKYDFGAAFTEEQQRSGAEYNYRHRDDPGQQAPGMSAFALADGVVYHTYSTYERGVEQLMGTYRFLDLAPLGRNEEGLEDSWWRRHDEYESRPSVAAG